ncbi:MAG: putative reductase, iron-sulfur cluster-binding subunit [Ignavibacteria bacterium]|nr:putative reductase, iron-sulfur cluster-binding subunit [Ignavibacteria bacterium]
MHKVINKSEKAKNAEESFKKKMNRQAILSFGVCVHCGMCTESCHYYLATKDPKMAPAYKADRVRKLYKKYFDWTGRLLPKWVGGDEFNTDDDLTELMDIVYGSCTMCRRCSFNCPMGVDKALLMRTGRAILTEQGIAPQGIIDVSEDQWKIGNQMGISTDDFLETIEWLNDELKTELDDPSAEIPIDKPNCNIIYAVNPREIKYAPMSLLAIAKIFHVANESWTMASKGWDNTNFGLFSGDNKLGAYMGNLVYDSVERLNGNMLVTSECGHGYRATAWESPNWAARDLNFRIYNVLEIITDYVKSGRIKLDKSLNQFKVTYHDPCNLGRSGGITEEPRYLINRSVSDYREMYPNRADNFCCTGGGGAMSMGEYSKRRLETAIVKADQLRATGADIVATACHNCVDGLTDLIKFYKLKMKVSLVGELVADALVYQKMYKVPEIKPEEITQYKVLVIDDEPDVIMYLTALLEDNGYKTISAATNEEALTQLDKEHPDLITLDLIMPGKSGLTFYHTLRTNAQYKGIPVVIVSGVNPENPGQYDSRSFIYQHSLPRPEGYIEKPVNKELLLMTIEKILELKNK